MIDSGTWLGSTKHNLTRNSGDPDQMVFDPSTGGLAPNPYSIGEFAGDAIIPVVGGGSLPSMIGEFGRGLVPTLGNVAYAGVLLFAAFFLFSFRRRWSDLLACTLLATEGAAIRGMFKGITGLIGGRGSDAALPSAKANYLEEMSEVRGFLANGLDDTKRAALADMVYNSMVQHGEATPRNEAEADEQRQRMRAVVSRAATRFAA